MVNIRETVNLILYEEFDFGINELQISNLIFDNLTYLIENNTKSL